MFKDLKIEKQFKNIIKRKGLNYLQACEYADKSLKYSGIPYHTIDRLLKEIEINN